MVKLFPQRETDMYPVIEEYFLKTLKCDKVFKDGDETFLSLKKNLRKGEVDLTALEDVEESNCKIHLVEAKSFAKRHSFQECLHQITAIKDSGNYLWVAFPEREWESLNEKEKKENITEIKEKGLGLLLVNENVCYPEIKSPLNKISEENKNTVLEHLGLFAGDTYLPIVETLGGEECKKAARIMLLMEMVENCVKEITKKMKVDTQEGNEDSFTKYFYNTSIYLSDHVGIEFDPFSCYLRDSAPSVWVWLLFNDSSTKNDFEKYLNSKTLFGTHILLDNNDWDWKIIPIHDRNQVALPLIKKGFTNIWFGNRIEINGRHKESLKKDMEQSITEAKRKAKI
ncbi:MAG: hypothetical protein NTU66_05980 [Elusimicrobia bacterium]|nr:hypothetical protein [Elusimicrobiota bacterium]